MTNVQYREFMGVYTSFMYGTYVQSYYLGEIIIDDKMTLNTAVWEVWEVPTQIKIVGRLAKEFFFAPDSRYHFLHQIRDLFWFTGGGTLTAFFKRGFQRDFLLLSTSKPSVWRDSPIFLLDEESKKDQERRWKTWSVSFFQSPLMKSHASLRPIQTSLIPASKKVHAGVTFPLLQGWSEKYVSVSWTCFFLEREHFFRCPKVLSFLETPQKRNWNRNILKKDDSLFLDIQNKCWKGVFGPPK